MYRKDSIFLRTFRCEEPDYLLLVTNNLAFPQCTRPHGQQRHVEAAPTWDHCVLADPTRTEGAD